MNGKKEGFVENLVDDVTTNPDVPQNSNAIPPQTTDAEPTSDQLPEQVPDRNSG